MVKELFRITLTGIALFYAGINLGFESDDYTEVNQTIWLDACFTFVGDLENYEKNKDQVQNGFYIDPDLLTPPDSTITTGNNIPQGPLDSLSNLQDSLLVKDTTKVDLMALDSTARLEYYRYHREDKPYVTLKRERSSSFVAAPQKTRVVEIDSTGQFVTITEKVAGQEPKIILRLTFDEYIELRRELKERETWESIGYAYELKSGKKDLGGLIKDFTDFEIPLPSVGVLSIFGEPKISLKIGGAVDIHGAWRTETTEGVTASRLGNTRNEPDFKQQVAINVNGTIGDKLNISADWNTERTFEYENQLKIKYTGYEDEIIQSIEAGNVSLQTSPLVGGSEALFGVKANFKMGPLSLTTLASQKKGEIKEVSVSGGSTSQTFEIRAWNYSENNYFLDTLYASTTPERNYFFRYYSNPTPDVDPRVEVIDIEVWKSTYTQVQDQQRERLANAYINLPPRTKDGAAYPEELRLLDNPQPGVSETGRFIKLTQDVDYKLHPETGYITFITNIQDQDVIAVAFRMQGDTPGSSDDLFYGEFVNQVADQSARLILKLIKPKSLQPGFRQAWRLQLRNIYYLGGRDIKEEGFDFRIKYEIEGQDPVQELATPTGSVRLLEAFGLDKYDANKQPNPDNKIDFLPGFTILPVSGEVIFPFLEPFGTDLPESLPDSIAYHSIYDTPKVFSQQIKIRDKWVLTGQYSGSATSKYNLGFNVVENSVRVRLNGRDLTAGVDYTMDYNVGQLLIRNEAALVPGADLRITYEQNELFSLASKTLLGARGLFDFSKKTKLGFSILNLNQQTLTDKVRIGEEPLSNTIYGVDFSTSGDLPFLTKLLDNVISTRQMSTFSVAGEYAYINPDPNTKKSTIASDIGKSIAYIDDFEAAKQIIPVGISYTAWRDISPPDRLPLLPDTLSKRQLMDYKAKSFWFTATPSNVTVNDIWGERKKVAKADQYITVMDYVYIPDTNGTFNYYPNLADPTRSWGGIMKLLSSTATNLVQENIEFIEFWANVNTSDPNAKIYIDLGRISEDVIPNGILDEEDKNSNDAIDEGEDTGLDGLFSASEGDPGSNGLLTTPVTRNDPSGDDFVFKGSINSTSLYDYYGINGSEGNAILSDIGKFPDTEDLNKNGNIDKVNSYFRYEIPLDTNSATNPYIAGGGDNAGWYLFRIPLRESVAQIGDPNLTTVETIRMFVTGTSSITHLRLAEFNLVGNQWRKNERVDSTGRAVVDSVLTLSVINYEDNPEYESPPQVFRERDRSRPDEEIYRNEQSLNLVIKDLPEGETREGVKYLARSLDVFNYTEMKLFIHGEENVSTGSISYSDENGYSADVFFRFGGDTNNYYEYRQPVLPGWNEISILFSQLTAIKQARGDSISQITRIPVPGSPDHYYVVKGNPSLTSVKFLMVGVYNNNGSSIQGPLSGQVWINELRVIGADDSPGWAYNISSSLRFADLLSVNFNMSEQNANFHKIADRFGNRVAARNWSVNADLDVLKLLPFTLNDSNLKVNYSHTESVGKPVYVPGTDIRVMQAAEQLDRSSSDTLRTKTGKQLIAESQTVNISDTWAVPNIKLKIPTSFWLIRDTFNALTFSFNYNKSFMRSPTVINNKAWVWNAQMNYGINLSPDYFFYPVNIPVISSAVGLFSDYRNVKIYYVPQSFSANVSSRRNKSVSVNRAQGNTPVNESRSRDFTAQRGFGFNWKMTEGGFFNLTTNYNVDISSSLAYLETDAFGKERRESKIWEDIFSGAFFGKDYSFRQNIDIKSNPRLPALWDIVKYFTISAGYSANYQWNNDFRQEELGRSASTSNRSNIGLTIRLKNLTAPLFKDDTDPNMVKQQQNLQGRVNQTKIDTTVNDSLALADSLLKKQSPLTTALALLKSTVKYIFFDYDNISINFSNDNTIGRSGIYGIGSGLKNFWGFSFKDDYGPSRGFMFGLSSNVGRRARNGNLQDVFSQRNSLDFKTSRPLWEGAKIDLNWKVGWSINKTTTLRSDELGRTSIASMSSTGTINRSFFSLPPVLIFSVFKNGITKVNELYDPAASDPNASLSNAFLQGFETLPILSKVGFLNDVAKYIPRPNWRISWEGLEKFFLFKSAKRVTLDHAYNSTYTEGWKLTPDGVTETQTQKIEYGFAPLAGLNISFGEVWGGNLNANLKYNTRTSYDLGVSTKNITESFNKDIGVTAGYQKAGFELPLFGLALKNDIEFSFSYTNTKTSTIIYNMTQFTETGTPQDGTTRVTIEPRIKYTISAKVTLSIFYRRATVEPEGASRIPPTTTNEAGLDVRIDIRP